MKLNSTYELTDSQGFINNCGSSLINTNLANKILRTGGTIRPLVIDDEGRVVKYALGDNSIIGSMQAGDYTFITKEEMRYFTKVKEGYPETEIETDFPTIHLTVSSREQAIKAIESLKALLK